MKKSVVKCAVIFVLILSLSVLPALADTARGKLTSDAPTRSAGSFVFKSDDYSNLTLTVRVRKLVPNESYYVGWAEYVDGALRTHIYGTFESDSRGNLQVSVFNGHVYDEPGILTFQAFVDPGPDVAEPWDLYGPEVEITF